MDVTLDKASAHPNLQVSEDGKTVWWGDEPQPTNNEQCFDVEPYVLANIGRSLRAYWEVSVEDKDEWVLGIAWSKVDKKGQLVLSPANGFWVIRLSNRERLKAMNDEEKVIEKAIPNKVGIYLDYEVRTVAFYNVDEKSLIYKFENGPGYDKEVRPLFSPWNNDGNPIRVLSISCHPAHGNSL